MATDKKANDLKVTDKRIFTPEGDIREEFQTEIHPSDPATPEKTSTADAAPPPPEQAPPDQPARDKGANPGTEFSGFIESLVVQAYMSLGMVRNPYGDIPVDPAAARQMIDILTMLQEKTKGNITEDEREFLDTHLGQLKLAWVRQSKSI